MPPKKEEKKEIVRIFDPPKFWQYQTHDSETLDKVQGFLTNFEKELIDLVDNEKTLEENYEVLCDKMGLAVHPSLCHKPQEQSKYPELHNNDFGQKYLKILNYKVDALSLKLLAFLLSHFKISSLKLSRIDADTEAEDLKKLLEKETSSTLLFFQWNPLQEVPNRNQIFLSTVRPNIQHLVLRQDKLGNQIARDIIKKIKSYPEITLKTLDLTGNNLTGEIGEEICNFVQEEKNLLFLGLSNNQLNEKKFLSKLFSSIGEIPLSEEEYAQYQETVKVRDQTIERNKKKKKGAPDEPVPFVFDIKETEAGRFYVKNTSLQNLNLAKNGIGDSKAGLVRSFVEKQGAKIELFLDDNRFTKKTKDILRAFGNILI